MIILYDVFSVSIQYGRTMLHYAAENGQIDIINYLLDIGADPNIQDEVSIC